MGNEKRLLWAGFTAILAAGVGFAIRGGIFDNWQAEYGFTGGQLGAIGGYGFTGFCFGIVLGGVVVDKLGYGKLVLAAFALHVVSALVTFAATGIPKDASAAQQAAATASAYNILCIGMFIFAFANGVLEAVANPLVATLFPQNRTHYLNILHASWPLGMILGGVVGWVLDDKMQVGWKVQLALYLIPTVIYGVMFLGQKFPKSEAAEKGLSMGDMFKDVGILGGAVVCFLLAMFFGGFFTNFMVTSKMTPEEAAAATGTAKIIGYVIGGALLVGMGVITKFSMGSILLFFLFIAHALVGAVELGTDGWIQNITGAILSSEQGKFLFVFTSLVMFGLRFCAHFIEKKMGLSPVGILLVCAVLACIGLNLTSGVSTFVMAMLALTVYGIGKTFFWPTMLAVASDRFPRTGAVAISFMGGIGMLSAGLVGSAGLGYAKDRFTGEDLKATQPAIYESVKAEKPSAFLFFAPAYGVDGAKLGAAQAAKGKGNISAADDAILKSDIQGSRKTLVADSFIPAMMAVLYLGILLYFKSIGGYKPVTITGDAAPAPAPAGPPA
jgi:MFS family permease